MRSAAQSRPRSMQPGARESLAAVLGENPLDARPDRSWRRRRKGRAPTRTEAQFEQAIAAPRLAVIVALGRRPRDDLDLAVVEAEAAIDRGDLRLDRALVRQEDPRRAALDDRRRDRAVVDVGERLGGEDDGGVLLAQRLQPFAQLARRSRDRRGRASLRR